MTLRPSLAAIALAAALTFGAAPRVHAQEATPITRQDAQASAPAAKQDLNEAKKEGSGEDENTAMRHSSMVQKLGHLLGLKTEPAAKLFNFLNFLVLAVAIIWALAKFLPKTFKSRVNGIQKNLVEARTASESANIRLAAVEERLSRLDTEIAEIRTRSEQDAAQDEQRIKAAVEEDKQKVIAQAEQEIAAATVQAQRQIRQYAAEMVITQATQRLQVSADLDRQLITEFASKLKPGSEN
ncbi:MAG: ATP synthase F0 subunit B [Acidobacteriaceae bacterium]|nr:ATP synthase F0 subunit B [Acidobacteriaceae bacterium]